MSTYDQLKQRQMALALGSTEVRKAALAAGLATYIAPLCGGGFTNHRRSAATGRCIDCRAETVKRRAAAAEALKPKKPEPPPPSIKSVLRAQAIAAGLTRYAVPLCGGGFTNHHCNVTSGSCVECRRANAKRRRQRKSAAKRAGL